MIHKIKYLYKLFNVKTIFRILKSKLKLNSFSGKTGNKAQTLQIWAAAQ